MNLLAGLNGPQKEAVQHKDGPLLILAGAGSGKTRVITYRTAYLIKEQGLSPHQILAVTFTNKAAGEMKERIENLLQMEASHLWISTFHSLGARILRQEAEAIGYQRNYTIIDPRDQQQIIKEITPTLQLNPNHYPPMKAISIIDGAKNELLNPWDYQSQAMDGKQKRYGLIYEGYQQLLQEQNLMDFGDLLFKLVELFVAEPSILKRYQERFPYILVDEYQDVNKAQYRLIRLLAGERENLCVVGDPDQGIYSFRGASIANILRFEEDFPAAKVVKLEENYRSSAVILKAAQDVIKNNHNRKEKDLFTRREGGEKIFYYQAPNHQGEADFVAQEMLRLQEEGYSFSQMALFYRTNAQSRIYEEKLQDEKIPHLILGAIRFYDRMEIKDILAYLRLVNNPSDTVSLLRILNVPRRNIGTKTRHLMEEFAQERGLSLFAALGRVDEMPIPLHRKEKIQTFYSLIQELMEERENLSVAELTEKLLSRIQYMEYLVKSFEDGESRQENVMEFLHLIYERSEEMDLLEFLAEISLFSDLDTEQEEQDAAVLMTLHTAKGLEFPVVFFTGLEEDYLPHSLSKLEEGGVEEERRLCYVGMTRAMERLYLSNARSRYVFGEMQPRMPSRFMKEIPQEMLVFWEKDREWEQDGGGGEQEEQVYGVGDWVQHARFGQGEVLGWEGKGQETIMRIFFPAFGEKRLLLSMAPLKPWEE